MAKSKKKNPKKKNIQMNNNVTVRHNKDIYTDEYKHQKEYQESQKPLILRLFVVAVACVIFLSFVILPLVK
ncbi:MAG: hypothetical protein LUG94_01615 [Ruminococcus sp.]|nr:hypothetical protein [Ruminococcus sp.]